jgi:3,4-dihydroxy 2-butanone 4-phosphate synthase
MVSNNESLFKTPLTVSIEARKGVTTDVSAADRVTTIRTAIANNAVASDLTRPGHVFPLRAAAGGVLERQGHTEGSVELPWLHGLQPPVV